MDISNINSKDLMTALIGTGLGTPVLILLFKRFLLKNILSDADLTVINTYMSLIDQLKKTNDHLVEQNDQLIQKVQDLENEVLYLKQELIGLGIRKHPRSDQIHTRS